MLFPIKTHPQPLPEAEHLSEVLGQTASLGESCAQADVVKCRIPWHDIPPGAPLQAAPSPPLALA